MRGLKAWSLGRGQLVQRGGGSRFSRARENRPGTDP